MEDTTVTGDLPVSDASAERIVFWFNDATGTKINTHLDTRMDLRAVTCRQDGRPYYAVEAPDLGPIRRIELAPTVRPAPHAVAGTRAAS